MCVCVCLARYCSVAAIIGSLLFVPLTFYCFASVFEGRPWIARPPKMLINYCRLTILFSRWLWTNDSSVTSSNLECVACTHTSILNMLIEIYHSVQVRWNFTEFKSSLTETDGAIQYCINLHWYTEVIHKAKRLFSIKSSDLIIQFSTLCELQRNKGNSVFWVGLFQRFMRSLLDKRAVQRQVRAFLEKLFQGETPQVTRDMF